MLLGVPWRLPAETRAEASVVREHVTMDPTELTEFHVEDIVRGIDYDAPQTTCR